MPMARRMKNFRNTVIGFLKSEYEKHLDQLIDVIMLSCPPKGIALSIGKSAASGGHGKHAVTKPEILSNICELLCFCILHHPYICELLCFCILHHPYRIKCIFLLNNGIGKVLFLVHKREKYLVVAAVRFMHIIISRNDPHYRMQGARLASTLCGCYFSRWN